MAYFTIRVVLHDGASWDDYHQLARALAARNISDVIVSDDGVGYKMPPAEYQCQGDLTAEQVRQICAVAAQTTGKRHAILVTEAKTRSWSGLDPLSR